MEKFGIFELLDALAALASENAPPQESGSATPAPSATFSHGTSASAKTPGGANSRAAKNAALPRQKNDLSRGTGRIFYLLEN